MKQGLSKRPFWEVKRLDEMTGDEWESLCDGCALCCLHKLEDDETGETFYTDVACRLLDLDKCRCTRYADRQRRVPDCVRLTPARLEALKWMPATCAYRLVHEGKPLYDWHPLISGDAASVHRAGASIRGRAVSERDVHEDDIAARVVHWEEVEPIERAGPDDDEP